jgi:hypothetical protein
VSPIKKLYRVFSLLCTILVVGYGAYAAVYYLLTIDARQTGSAFFQALNKKDLNGAYGLLDTSLQQKFTTETFAKLDTDVGLSQFDKVKWHSWKINGNVYEIGGTIHSEKGFSTETSLKLVKRKGTPDLKVYAFEIKPVEKPIE